MLAPVLSSVCTEELLQTVAASFVSHQPCVCVFTFADSLPFTIFVVVVLTVLLFKTFKPRLLDHSACVFVIFTLLIPNIFLEVFV